MDCATVLQYTQQIAMNSTPRARRPAAVTLGRG
jgi:hypothetical protein